MTEHSLAHFSLGPSGLVVPATVSRLGHHAERRFIEFFTAQIRNRGTRRAYGLAVNRFFDWCDQLEIELQGIEPVVVATYIEQLGYRLSAPTVKLHLAAIRMLFDYLVTGHIVESNPAAAVRGPKHVIKKGKTPVLSADEARALLDAIQTDSLIGLRDRALIGVMVYSFARVSATLGMNIGDVFTMGRRIWFRLHEKGGKYHEVPAHHNAEAYVDAYLAEASSNADPRLPLFRTFAGNELTDRRMHRTDALRMIKRRAAAADLPTSVCCHTFRATGITAYLNNGGTLEHAMQIAAHESARTTKLYDRTSDDVSLDEIERIVI